MNEIPQSLDPAAEGAAPPRVAALAGKYLTFELAAEAYGLAILEVREIIGLMAITAVPRAASFVRGVINLRGRVIPVIDLRVRFAMPPAPPTEQSVVIVVQCRVGGRQLTVGLLVDRVLEVLGFEAAAIEPPPELVQGTLGDQLILGVGKAAHRVVFLLDLDRILSGADALRLPAPRPSTPTLT